MCVCVMRVCVCRQMHYRLTTARQPGPVWPAASSRGHWSGQLIDHCLLPPGGWVLLGSEPEPPMILMGNRWFKGTIHG